MEEEARGWWSVQNKFVCAECFEDKFLQEFVAQNAEASKCAYCGWTAEEITGEVGALIAAPFDSVMKIIAGGFNRRRRNYVRISRRRVSGMSITLSRGACGTWLQRLNSVTR
jgi:hypothetical protein